MFFNCIVTNEYFKVEVGEFLVEQSWLTGNLIWRKIMQKKSKTILNPTFPSKWIS